MKYDDIQGKLINGEVVPTKAQVKEMKGAEFRDAHPFVKRNCADCAWCVAAMSWWCHNEEIIKMRGTRIPGISFCPGWEPRWSDIPKKYHRPEYGYVPTWWERFVERFKTLILR